MLVFMRANDSAAVACRDLMGLSAEQVQIQIMDHQIQSDSNIH